MKIEVKTVKLSEIKLNPDNPRTISTADMDRLVKSLQAFPEMMELREIICDETMCLHPKLKKGKVKERVRLLQRSFDLNPYLRAYDPEEKHPAWFLSSYTDNEKLRKIYEIAEKRFGL